MADAVIVMALASRDAAYRNELSREEGGASSTEKKGTKWQSRRLHPYAGQAAANSSEAATLTAEASKPISSPQ
jgi:hypothetical protein